MFCSCSVQLLKNFCFTNILKNFKANEKRGQKKQRKCFKYFILLNCDKSMLVDCITFKNEIIIKQWVLNPWFKPVLQPTQNQKFFGLFSRVQKRFKFGFAREAIIIFIKSLKKHFCGIFFFIHKSITAKYLPFFFLIISPVS